VLLGALDAGVNRKERERNEDTANNRLYRMFCQKDHKALAIVSGRARKLQE
jgi:hypothetical protein